VKFLPKGAEQDLEKTSLRTIGPWRRAFSLLRPAQEPKVARMKTEDAIAFLKSHQPMPSDHEITDAEGAAFSEIIKHFEQNPDPRCIPLLIGAVSKNTGLGMYEHIKFVLMAHSKDEVAPHLRYGLCHGNDGTKYRCCWWACDVDAWELEDVIRPLVDHEDEDIQDAASTFLELKEDLG
jgi:hypothetical protein